VGQGQFILGQLQVPEDVFSQGQAHGTKHAQLSPLNPPPYAIPIPVPLPYPIAVPPPPET